MFSHCIMEALLMCWRKRDLRKAVIAGMLLLLVYMVWVPLSAAGAHEGASESAESVTVTAQATPTVDVTVTALNKEKLAQEIQQLKNQNAPTFFDWLRGNVSILLLGLGALAGFFRWLGDRRDAHAKELEDREAERSRRDEEQKRWLKDQEAEREKRAEERFQAAVTGLGEDKEGAKIGAAILLRTFLRPGYEQFYTQTFDLAVANLRLPRESNPPKDPKTPLPLTTLSQALIVVFKEAFPLARNQNSKGPQALDATGIQLDNAYLRWADLEQVWMAQASLRKANLREADLRQIKLYKANLNGADLRFADLSQANLSGADLSQANLGDAKISGADFSGASLSRANLSEADLSGASLSDANLNGAGLWRADLSRTNLRGADLSRANLREANLEDALSMQDTNLRGVEGLTKKQLEACKLRGAIIDEDPASSTQSTALPSSLLQSNDARAQSVPPAQRSIPTPDTSGSGAPTSQQPSES
jgi:uncharacterized protein YjbI with pentapeptide repeats